MPSPQDPSVLLILPSHASARDAVLTGTLAHVANTLRTVVMSPLADDEAFWRDMTSLGATLVPFPVEQHNSRSVAVGRATAAVRELERLSLAYRAGVATVRIEEEGLRQRSPLRYWLRRITAHAAGARPWLVASARGIERQIATSRRATAFLSSLGVDAVVCYDSFHPTVRHLLNSAASLGLPTLAVIQSWDNLTAKGQLVLPFQGLVVWNDVMRSEALQLYPHLSEETVSVVGGLAFDYPQRSTPLDRVQLFQQYGFNPNKRLITFMLGYPDLYPDYRNHVAILSRAIVHGDISDAHLLIRVQPGPRSASVWEELREIPGLVSLDNSVWRSGQAWDGYQKGLCDYWTVIANSDVVVNYCSTTTIDAAVFDRPNVSIAFDGDDGLLYHHSIRRYFDRTHYQMLMQSGANTIVHSPEGLLRSINRYLADPSIDTVSRAKVVRSLVGPLDGNSGQRAAEAIVTFATRVGSSS